MPNVFVTAGSSSYHTDSACQALDTARLNAGGTVRVITAEEAADKNRPACLVCATPATEEWTITRVNCGQLWELIGPSKLHTSLNTVSGKVEVDGLTILEHDGLPRVLARFGDTIHFGLTTGRYTVHHAALEG